MSNIKDLPGAGNSFRVTTGAGNFTRKFNSATRVGALHNLQDNKASILKVIKKSEGAIRIGKFDRLRQLSAWHSVKKMEGSKLTKDDKREIKLIFKHLGSRKDGGGEKGSGIHIEKQLDRDNSFEEERKKDLKAKVGRFDRSTNGGEAKLNFTSRPEGVDDENLSMSGKLLQRRFGTREQMLKGKLPSVRITRDMGAVQPPPAITRGDEPHMPDASDLDIKKNMSNFQSL